MSTYGTSPVMETFTNFKALEKVDFNPVINYPKFTVNFEKFNTPELKNYQVDFKKVLLENAIKDESYEKNRQEKNVKKIVEPEVQRVWDDAKIVLDVSQPTFKLQVKELIGGKILSGDLRDQNVLKEVHDDIVTHFETKITQDLFKMIKPISDPNFKFFDPSMPTIAKIYTDPKYSNLVKDGKAQVQQIANSFNMSKGEVIVQAMAAAEQKFMEEYTNVKLKPDILPETQGAQLLRFIEYKKLHPEDTSLINFPKVSAASDHEAVANQAKHAALEAFRNAVHANQYDCSVTEAKLMSKLEAIAAAFDPSKLGIQQPARGRVIDIPDEAYNDEEN